MRVSLMDTNRMFKYGIIILISVTILALVGIYEADIFAEIITNKDILVFIELVFVMLIIAFLMYALMIIIEGLTKNDT